MQLKRARSEGHELDMGDFISLVNPKRKFCNETTTWAEIMWYLSIKVIIFIKFWAS